MRTQHDDMLVRGDNEMMVYFTNVEKINYISVVIQFNFFTFKHFNK